jgi:uncharacterized membrane protein SpoIIM required for sporulation
MREVAFIRQNKEKWIEFEKITTKKGKEKVDSDKLSHLYIQVMNDLSYAQTYYPESKLVNYLNSLAANIYLSVYKSNQIEKNRLKNFFFLDVPLLSYKYRYYFYAAFAIFFLFLGMGILSAMNDNSFCRLILGDDYVNTTLENIKKGDPVAIYKSGSNWGSFIGITINNLKVGAISYVFGLFLGLGSIYILMNNTIMLGSFQYFFAERGVLLDSVRGIWIHGSMEITGMIIEAACGLALGFSFLFPGSYSRLNSFRIGFKNTFKIFCSTMIFTLMAGFLEGYITRYSNVMPLSLCFTIIGVTLFMILFYYFIYPVIIYKKVFKEHN